MQVSTIIKLIIPIIVLSITSCTQTENPQENESAVTEESGALMLNFWNGNRSDARMDYERKVLIALLEATEADFGAWEINEYDDEYPGDEESLVFTEKGHDLFVTIAGNAKFSGQDAIVIPELLTRNLLGYRIPIIREEDAEKFRNIETKEEIQQLVHGIPETWSDAVIFRENGFQVAEEGDFEDVFDRLAAGRFDYSAYGANEVLSIYENRASLREGLTMDHNLLLFYQFPLVFYVHPEKTDLAERIGEGMRIISTNGVLDSIFEQHYGSIVDELDLTNRKLIILDNPLIPDAYRNLVPELDKL